jgi:hypothetical protein
MSPIPGGPGPTFPSTPVTTPSKDFEIVVLGEFQTSFTMVCRATSWLDDDNLGDVPVASGTVTFDRSMNVPESVNLTVPRIDRGVSWDPLHADDPLAANGQQLNIQIGIGVVDDVNWINLGWYLITDNDVEGDDVSVTCAGLLKLIDEARFLAPFQPSGTFVSTTRDLVEPALTVVFDDALVDRNVPLSMQWEQERLSALNELLDAWPADAEVTADGYLFVHVPPDYTTGTPVWDFSDDDVSGTVSKWKGTSTRDGAFSVVVAAGEDPSGNQVQAVAYDTDPTSPSRIDGPFNPLPVPFFYFSPLLNNLAECRKAAATILARKKRDTARKIAFDSVPNFTLRPGNLVTVSSVAKELDKEPASIESIAFPLNPGGGAMTGEVALVN